jgi:WD40 repeat protein
LFDFNLRFRDQPIHLFDAYTGAIRATYCPYNALDEMESPAVVTFSSDGQRVMAAGFRSDRVIHVFNTATPGRDSTCLRLGKTRRSSDGQKGHVSALTFSSNERVFCVGTYSPGSIYVYDERTGQQPSATILNGVSVVGHGKASSRKKRHFTNMESPSDDENENDKDNEQDKDWFSAAKVRWFKTRAQGGITQLKFAPNEEYILYSASRRANTVISWDLRMISGNPEYQSNPIRGMGSFETDSDTNQRLEFDLDDTGKHLYVGGRDKCVRIYDVASGNLEHTIDGLDDAANGVSFCKHSSTQNSYLAVATGSRRFPSEEDFDNDAVPQASEQPPGFLSLYKV